jgi:ribosome biogenesis GTPase A
MSHHHFQQHDMSFNSATKNISVHEISDLKTNQLKKAPPLPQPQLTMWDLSYSSSLPRVAGGPRRASAESSSQQQQHLLNKTLYPYQSLSGTQPLLFFSPPTPETVQQIYRIEPDEEPMQHLVLLPLGKTGAGKSSLLNLLLGYNEFKSKPGAKSVTDKITERTGTWTIENAADTLITVADTPGFADSMQRDEGFQRVFQDYIEDLGSRLGIDAFLLCFQCDSSTNK